MRILVLGAYGLIGSAVAAALARDGHAVTGLGRDDARGRRSLPGIEWRGADIARLVTPGDWTPILQQARCEAVVNCAGALQDGARDRVARLQSTAMQALYVAAAATNVSLIVQISAPRADPAAGTTFMRTKGEADRALAAAPFDWVILRPGLVLAPEAYGGTALLRALASFPLVTPLAYAGSPIQTVGVADVAAATAAVVAGRIPRRRTYDLVEDRPHTLAEIVAAMRAWLGLRPATVVPVPAVVARALARIADALGWLGWRSPLRSTAMAEIAAGVTADPEPWRGAGGHRLKSLDETLATMPPTVQERWFGRLYLLKALVIATLAAFWIATGLITLANVDAAAAVLAARGVGMGLARAIAASGALLDIALGLAVLIPGRVTVAVGGMVGLTLAYLAGATLIAPDLWRDPLGPLVKPIPAMVLALVAWALAEER